MWQSVFAIFLIFTWVTTITCLPNGAPTQACTSMTPHHIQSPASGNDHRHSTNHSTKVEMDRGQSTNHSTNQSTDVEVDRGQSTNTSTKVEIKAQTISPSYSIMTDPSTYKNGSTVRGELSLFFEVG